MLIVTELNETLTIKDKYNDKIFIGINIDILNINIKKCKLHILPSLKLIYHTINGYITIDIAWLIFELRLYIVYKYIKK